MSSGSQKAIGDAAIVHARQLLTRTAELPDNKGELLAVLVEYRQALHTLAVTSSGDLSLAAGGDSRAV
jgi:hypothetical protein